MTSSIWLLLIFPFVEPLTFFFFLLFNNLNSVLLNCISFGISTRTGPGLPDVATSNARSIVRAKSLTSFTNQLCLVHGLVIPVVSHS